MTAPEPEGVEPLDDPRRVPTHVEGPWLYGLTGGPLLLMLSTPLPWPVFAVLFFVLWLIVTHALARWVRPRR